VLDSSPLPPELAVEQHGLEWVPERIDLALAVATAHLDVQSNSPLVVRRCRKTAFVPSRNRCQRKMKQVRKAPKPYSESNATFCGFLPMLLRHEPSGCRTTSCNRWYRVTSTNKKRATHRTNTRREMKEPSGLSGVIELGETIIQSRGFPQAIFIVFLSLMISTGYVILKNAPPKGNIHASTI
jgi:hypothetical protein